LRQNRRGDREGKKKDDSRHTRKEGMIEEKKKDAAFNCDEMTRREWKDVRSFAMLS